jgi:hypothetical protein
MADGYAPQAGGGDISVETLRRQYENFAADKREELKEQRTARHYYHADQYTAAELAEMRRRKQPPVTTPRLTKKINGIVGLLERMRQDPKAFPRTPQQEAGAELGTAVLRYALDAADWRATSAEVCLNAAVNGIGVVEFSIAAGDRGDPEIDMAVVDPETWFYDQRSVRPDFSDARFRGVAKWVDLDVAVEMFPDREEEIRNLVTRGAGGFAVSEQTADRETRWVNSQEKQLFLVEHWYLRRAVWHWCFYCWNVKLAGGQSPWKDEKGNSIDRYEAFSANVDHDGDRYGFVRHLKSPTDETNARRSKALHIMHTRRIIASDGAVNDVEKARREAVRPDGYILVNPGEHRFDFDDAAKAADWQSQIALLQEAKNELENYGPNPQLMGEMGATKNQSGRAIALLQQAGIAELGPFILAHRNWKLRVYRKMWHLIRQTWTGERWIRVTDDDNVAQFVALNRLEMTPAGPQIVNALGALDVDIILDEGPDTLNVMQDAYDLLIQLAQGGAQVPPDVLIELSGLPAATKKKLLDRLQQAAQPNPLMLEGAQTKIGLDRAKAAEAKARTIKTLADAEAALQPAPQPADAALPI